jgi:very-short-patch-repair endonuclease
VDRVIAEVARSQHGVVARAQLLAAGISRHQIALRLRNGRLHEMHRSVYLVGHAVRPQHAAEMAALLACGRHAVLSHRSAAAVWEVLPYPARAPAWVTVPLVWSARRHGIRLYRAELEARDIRRRHGMPLTSPPRTILDLAPLLDGDELERVVAEAHYRRLASETELRRQLERNPHKRGVVSLRRVLGQRGGPRRTRSSGERALLRLLREHGIDGFETNARIDGYEVDFLWRDRNLVVEVDGYDAHSGRAAFERDRLKAATLRANGTSVMPITGRQIRSDPAGVIGRILRALAVSS